MGANQEPVGTDDSKFAKFVRPLHKELRCNVRRAKATIARTNDHLRGTRIVRSYRRDFELSRLLTASRWRRNQRPHHRHLNQSDYTASHCHWIC